ncbi:MAG: hypothetical protein ACYDAJ_01165 [Nitrosotalea sp.]
MRHALNVDHITVIDNLVRLHNAAKKSRLVGAGFSSGHMISVLAINNCNFFWVCLCNKKRQRLHRDTRTNSKENKL